MLFVINKISFFCVYEEHVRRVWQPDVFCGAPRFSAFVAAIRHCQIQFLYRCVRRITVCATVRLPCAFFPRFSSFRSWKFCVRRDLQRCGVCWQPPLLRSTMAHHRATTMTHYPRSQLLSLRAAAAPLGPAALSRVQSLDLGPRAARRHVDFCHRGSWAGRHADRHQRRFPSTVTHATLPARASGPPEVMFFATTAAGLAALADRRQGRSQSTTVRASFSEVGRLRPFASDDRHQCARSASKDTRRLLALNMFLAASTSDQWPASSTIY